MIRRHLNPSLVISVIALFVALGGASYAAINLPKNSVGTKQLKAKSVTGAKVKDKSLTAGKLAAGVLPPGQGFFRSREPSPLLELTGTMTSVVATPNLPVGTYAITANATILNESVIGGATVTCSLASGTAQSIRLGTSGGGGSVLPLSLTTAVKIPNNLVTVPLFCSESAGDAKVAHASITAVPVKTIDGAPTSSP